MGAQRILIIDDEENFAHIVKMNLEQTGEYHVWVQTQAGNALDSAVSLNPDLILLDIVMPDKDGFEILQKLKKNKKTMAIPVIMLTAIGDDAAKIRASQEYSEGYVVKPIPADELKKKIDEVLQRR